MLQPQALKALVKRLFFEGYRITIETNGSRPWGIIEHNGEFKVHSWIVDYKLPGSTQTIFMHPFKYYRDVLTSDDFVKFVILGQDDFDEAVKVQRKLEDMGCEARFAYSTTALVVSHQQLAEWMLNSPEILSNAVLNLQIHKVIWPHEKSR
jgi:organic radical activating enzyme